MSHSPVSASHSLHVVPSGAEFADDGGYMALFDWRRRVAELYGSVRASADAEAGWQLWRRTRDDLFRHHSQSPIEPDARAAFAAVPYYPYDPALRLVVGIVPVAAQSVTVDTGADGTTRMKGFARTVGLEQKFGGELMLYWLMGYGGGVFVPFGDATNGAETYGGGRYLLDTIKGADLGSTSDGSLILDFNFAYNPSCSYSERWVCPPAPRANRLPVAVRGGERLAC